MFLASVCAFVLNFTTAAQDQVHCVEFTALFNRLLTIAVLSVTLFLWCLFPQATEEFIDNNNNRHIFVCNRLMDCLSPFYQALNAGS